MFIWMRACLNFLIPWLCKPMHSTHSCSYLILLGQFQVIISFEMLCVFSQLGNGDWWVAEHT